MNNIAMTGTSDPYSRYAVEAADNDIGAIVSIIAGRYKVILFCLAVCVGLAFVYVTNAKPQYVATARIMIAADNISIRQNIIQSLIATGRLDSADMLSQIQIILSPDTIKALIAAEKLYKVAEVGGSPDYKSFDALDTRLQTRMIRAVTGRLFIQPVIGTSLVEVNYRSGDPQIAADVANRVIEVYAEREKEASMTQARVVSEWLAERLTELRKEVREAEIALENARNANKSALEGTGDFRLTQIENLTTQLAQAEARYATTKAKMDQLTELKDTNGRLEILSDILDNRLFQDLKKQEADIKRRKAILSNRFGPNHPAMVALNAENRVFESTLEQEVEVLLEAMKSKANIDLKSIEELKKNIQDYRESYQADAENRIVIRDLQTTAETARALLNSFMASYLESQQRLNIEKEPVRIITEAAVPLSSKYPQKGLIIGLSGITGLFLGIFLALAFERLQNVFHNPKQIEAYLGVPLYAVLPKVRELKKISPADFIVSKPASGLAELMRSLYMNIKLRDPKDKSGARVITVTSTLPNEGKTTISAMLAATAAQGGEKVLIIDADMRRPSLHKSFGIGNAKGLADHLSNRLPIDEAIFTKHSSNVHVMTSKAIPTHALTLLTGERMETMMRRLREMYDLIILDVPTSRLFSDSQVVAKLSDKTLYVIESERTERDAVKNGLKQFKDTGCRNISVILNKAEGKQLDLGKSGDLAYLYQINKGTA